MKKIYLLAAAAALFAACSSDKVSLDTPQQPQLDKNEVGFDAYLQRATTRAGATGDLVNKDATANQANLWKEGFGVFAYYTDNRDYDQLAQPNFMYNQQVYKGGPSETSWTYEPVVYWPNEYGSNAISDDNDRVTFFAYAPYVKVDVKTGKFAPDASAVSTAETDVTDATTDLATAQTNYDDAVTAYVGSYKAMYDEWVAAGKPGSDPGDGKPGHNSTQIRPILMMLEPPLKLQLPI